MCGKYWWDLNHFTHLQSPRWSLTPSQFCNLGGGGKGQTPPLTYTGTMRANGTKGLTVTMEIQWQGRAG